ncbi:MAG TPA: FAD-binding oxidoreductase, partial [Polyangiaceae bacterium]|nr:FAD-binding oxidoreductase [Polyangiaceae bacterium]
MNRTTSLWQALPVQRDFPQLGQDGIHVDVAIIGGGITGVTAAHLLKARGSTVAILEARHIANGVTGCTTAHLTESVDARFYKLEQKFGALGARLVADSAREAIEQVSALVGASGLNCGFERLPGYLFAEHASQVEELEL